MLLTIKSYFNGLGHINVNEGVYNYHVMGLKICLIIRPHFTKYPLMTYKLIYFKLWVDVLDLMIKKDHLTESGLLKIIAIKFSFKKGINSNLIHSFPNIKPLLQYDYNLSIHLMNNAWLTGFINTDGSFGIYISKNSSDHSKYNVVPQIRIYQDVISLVVLDSIKNMLGNGILIKPNINRSVATLSFNNKEAISLIIKICNENHLHGAKNLDFLDFCKGY